MRITRPLCLFLASYLSLAGGSLRAQPLAQAESQEQQQSAAPVAARSLVSDPDQVRLIEAGREADGARRHIEVICGHFPRRMTGSPQLDLAQGWVMGSFEDWGGSARREQWGSVEVGFDRGESTGRVLQPEERDLTFITPAWSPGTLGPVRGRALLEPLEDSELHERQDEFEGAWLLRNSKLPRAARGARLELLEDLGVHGLIQAGARDGRLLMGGRRDLEWDDLPTLVRVTVLYEEYQELKRQVQGDEEVELEFDIGTQFLHGPLPQYNVIADIVGSEWPDEYVIVQAHLDAWDGAQGACDNGTGVATTMEAARLLLNLEIKPRRTIRFVFYGGEEQGLLGSSGYVERHGAELDKISVVLNHDNGTNYLAGIGPTAAMLEDFRRVFAPIEGLDAARPFVIRESPGLRGGPSDHGPFIGAGVPAFAWDQSNEGYRRLHHTQFDTLEEVNHDDQRHSSLVVALSALRFANLDHLLDRAFLREPQARLMGVMLDRQDGLLVSRVSEGGRAAKAGWQAGDRVLSIDGELPKGRRELVDKLQSGGPKKTFVLEREGSEIESLLDWSEDPLEAERAAWRARAAARAAAKESPTDG